MRPLPQFYWLAVAAAAALLAGACTQANIYQADGTVEVVNGFGVMRVSPQPGTKPQVVETKGVGIVAGQDSVKVGYFKSEVAALPLDDCRIVVWMNEQSSKELAAEIRRLGAGVCTVGPGAREQQ